MRALLSLIITFFLPGLLFSQSCPDNLVYWDLSPVRIYNPAMPYSGTNPINSTVTNGPGGLSYGPNLNGGSPSPTFYTVISGVYHYWNGSAWTSTGHAASPSAVNHGSGPGCLYNLVGGSGAVYKYLGTGPDFLLVTIPGWGGGGPYDVVVDNCCNFYLLKTSSPQALWCFDPNGVLTNSCTLSNLPSSSAGGGFAIVGNTVVLGNAGGLWLGAITGSNISFTNITTTITIFNDFASCPITCGGPCGVTLPIAFGSFKGTRTDHGNLLRWQTEMEENLDHFYVERSTDAVNFERLDKVKATGFAHEYDFTDTSPVSDVLNYYRITAVENNGATHQTYVIHLRPSGGGLMFASTAYPNPANTEINLMIESEGGNSAELRLFDGSGRMVRSQTKQTVQGMTAFRVPVDDLPRGIYLVSVLNSQGEIVTTQRITKED